MKKTILSTIKHTAVLATYIYFSYINSNSNEERKQEKIQKYNLSMRFKGRNYLADNSA